MQSTTDWNQVEKEEWRAVVWTVGKNMSWEQEDWDQGIEKRTKKMMRSSINLFFFLIFCILWCVDILETLLASERLLFSGLANS